MASTKKATKYNKVNLHLINLELKKITDAVKNNNGTTMRQSNENFNKNHLTNLKNNNKL